MGPLTIVAHRNWTDKWFSHPVVAVHHHRHPLRPITPDTEQETKQGASPRSPPATSLQRRTSEVSVFVNGKRPWLCHVVNFQKWAKSEAPTFRIFDQNVQLLAHSHLKRAILRVLCVVCCHAAVRLGDEWVGDAAPLLVSGPPPSSTWHTWRRLVVRQQDHHAACGREGMETISWLLAPRITFCWRSITHSTCSWCSPAAGHGLWV